MQVFKNLALTTLTAALLAAASGAQASLISRGNDMVYDSVLNVTWITDMNYAKTSGYDADGKMTWSEANTWANSLVYGGYDDWSLATIDQLTYLFVTELGNQYNTSVTNQTGDTAEQIANYALFSNVQSSAYWSSVEYAPFTGNAWLFDTDHGVQQNDVKGFTWYAVAVRPGDVAATTTTADVPEPQTLTLALLALGATAVARRKRRV